MCRYCFFHPHFLTFEASVQQICVLSPAYISTPFLYQILAMLGGVCNVSLNNQKKGAVSIMFFPVMRFTNLPRKVLGFRSIQGMRIFPAIYSNSSYVYHCLSSLIETDISDNEYPSSPQELVISLERVHHNVPRDVHQS